jgi:hypothetical protein
MAEAVSIIDEIEEQVLETEKVAGINEEIRNMCENTVSCSFVRMDTSVVCGQNAST